VLDRWLLSELNAVVRDATDALEAFDSAAAGRRIAAFIDDLSNWYVRRSRRRFWEGPGTPGGAAAFATLYTSVETLTRLMAPITPFITDYLWGVLHGAATGAASGSAGGDAESGPADADDAGYGSGGHGGAAPDSVHLASWPTADTRLIDEELASQMALARRLVELGRSARASAALRVRQPLARALIGADGFAGLQADLRAQVADELNVRVLDPLDAVGGDLVSYTARPSYRDLGKRFGKDTPVVAAAIEAADPAALAAATRATGAASVQVDGDVVSLAPEEVTITQTPRAGWAVATDGGETVALETAITPELRREGYARQFIRLVQEARKSDGLAVSDRVAVRWTATDPEVAEALAEHGALVSTEVLATDYGPGAGDDAAGREHADPDLGLTYWLRLI
jgi:isoleucyl-tRNA synthetase